MLPTFIICGAGKAGTSSLWNYLKVHPEVGMAVIKEPCFFTNVIGVGNQSDPIRPRYSGQYWRGIRWYENLFNHCVGKKAIGEASALYMSEPDAPNLIYQNNRSVKLIFLFRNPVDRLISHYMHEIRDGRPLPSLEKMIDQQHPTLYRYLYVSSYHLHLQRYLDIFPRKQISVYLFEDLIKNPLHVVQQAYQAIGVDSTYIPSNIGKRFNESFQVRVMWIHLVVRWLDKKRRLYLGPQIPKWLLNIGQQLIQLNRFKLIRPSLTDNRIKYLYSEFETTVKYIETFVGHQLESWHYSDQNTNSKET